MSRIDELLTMLETARHSEDQDMVNEITAELTAEEMTDIIHGWGAQYDEIDEFTHMIETHHAGGISRRGHLKEL